MSDSKETIYSAPSSDLGEENNVSKGFKVVQLIMAAVSLYSLYSLINNFSNHSITFYMYEDLPIWRIIADLFAKVFYIGFIGGLCLATIATIKGVQQVSRLTVVAWTSYVGTVIAGFLFADSYFMNTTVAIIFVASFIAHNLFFFVIYRYFKKYSIEKPNRNS